MRFISSAYYGKNAGVQASMVGHMGGTVGGRVTYGNKVDIPSGAMPEVGVVIVVAKTGDNIYLLPSMKFNKEVTVTLSYDNLALPSGTSPRLLVMDNKGGWSEVSGVLYDRAAKIGTFRTDHFTRYGWGI